MRLLRLRNTYGRPHNLLGAALLLQDRAEIERAVELQARVWRFQVASNFCWFGDVADREITAAAETLSPEVVATAQERGRKRNIWETAKALLEEFNWIQ